ncbi:hypothetical protein Cob_v008545 [Colletotrichum orbiculare MAFF 240422]|uniref:Uncharacterized protein n=1 Tax=Colletotrichum orbiculare (strain 104-T / ATCC 96160 / CBS 514.97 / LARS 414 / MAFF 240422) TaxID=1213857 RepID=A0A484FM58_COLOR|nr:hypothetical protein Cob_v008545 [Colletotrichum orbiculare MAFF 240422]
MTASPTPAESAAFLPPFLSTCALLVSQHSPKLGVLSFHYVPLSRDPRRHVCFSHIGQGLRLLWTIVDGNEDMETWATARIDEITAFKIRNFSSDWFLVKSRHRCCKPLSTSVTGRYRVSSEVFVSYHSTFHRSLLSKLSRF